MRKYTDTAENIIKSGTYNICCTSTAEGAIIQLLLRIRFKMSNKHSIYGRTKVKFGYLFYGSSAFQTVKIDHFKAQNSNYANSP